MTRGHFPRIRRCGPGQSPSSCLKVCFKVSSKIVELVFSLVIFRVTLNNKFSLQLTLQRFRSTSGCCQCYYASKDTVSQRRTHRKASSPEAKTETGSVPKSPLSHTPRGYCPFTRPHVLKSPSLPSDTTGWGPSRYVCL